MIGYVIETYEDGCYEVEFSDSTTGVTLALLSVTAEDLRLSTGPGTSSTRVRRSLKSARGARTRHGKRRSAHRATGLRGPPTNYRPFQMRRRPKQLELSPLRLAAHGGARDGAGRPPTSGRRPPVPHRVRPEHKARFPVHLTLRGGAGLPSLRSVRVFDAALPAVRRASNGRFRVLAFSVQTDHLHAIVEADNSRTLVAGIRGLAIRVALAVNRALARKGSVWSDRYHARELRTPQETRAAFLYVLQNWKKHLGTTRGIDGRSSGPWFDGWANTPARPSRPIPVASPRTWLAAHGLARAWRWPPGYG